MSFDLFLSFLSLFWSLKRERKERKLFWFPLLLSHPFFPPFGTTRYFFLFFTTTHKVQTHLSSCSPSWKPVEWSIEGLVLLYVWQIMRFFFFFLFFVFFSFSFFSPFCFVRLLFPCLGLHSGWILLLYSPSHSLFLLLPLYFLLLLSLSPPIYREN